MKMAVRLIELEMRCHGVKEQDDDMSESSNGQHDLCRGSELVAEVGDSGCIKEKDKWSYQELPIPSGPL